MDDKIAWYENDGSQKLHGSHDQHGGRWAEERVCGGHGLRRRLGCSQRVGPLTPRSSWHENDGSQNFTEHTISTLRQIWLSERMFAADMDSDGDMDVLSSSSLQDDKVDVV